MDEIHSNSLDAYLLDVGETDDGAGSSTVIVRGGIAGICSADEFMESGEDFGGLKGGHIQEAAPYLSSGSCVL